MGVVSLAVWVAPVVLLPVALQPDRLLPAMDALARDRRLHDPVPVLAHLPVPLAPHPLALTDHHRPVPIVTLLAPVIRAACPRPGAAQAQIATVHITRHPLAVHPLAVRRRGARW